MILIKLILTPFFILAITIAGRKWGPTASGLLIGLPLTSGPISVFLALQHGSDFAARAATGNVAGQVSMCLFCLVYFLLAGRAGWPLCSLAATAAFLVSTFALDRLALGLLAAFAALSALFPLFLLAMPEPRGEIKAAVRPRWDLPARVGMATAFVLLLTTLAQGLGPRLSGLLSPLPVFSLVIASFTLRQQGGEAAGLLLRGVVRSSWANAVFFLAVGLLLPRVALPWTYLAATVLALLASGATLVASRAIRARR